MGGKFKYYPGDRIGPNKILFLKRTSKDKNRKWKGLFSCPLCGTIFECYINGVQKGQTTSCGCYHKTIALKKTHQSNYKDLTNQKSGTWTFLNRSDRQNKNHTWYWDCVCENGHKKQILCSNFGKTKTCNKCEHRSQGEEKIEKILNILKINFIEQHFYKDCLSSKGHYLFFDFYLPDYNCCIEYDGIQHFKKTSWSHDNLEERQCRDKIKDKYCKDHNIKLIRIPYWDYDKLNEDYLLELINGQSNNSCRNN